MRHLGLLLILHAPRDETGKEKSLGVSFPLQGFM